MVSLFALLFSDVNECDSNPCEQQCENSPGSYRCLCNNGYTFNKDTGTCEGKAVNSENCPGSYRCPCNKGNTFNTDTGTCEGKAVNSEN